MDISVNPGGMQERQLAENKRDAAIVLLPLLLLPIRLPG